MTETPDRAPNSETQDADSPPPDIVHAGLHRPKSRAATVKVFLLLALALLMLLPVSWLLNLVRERQGRLTEAKNRIESGWGGAQRLLGPILYLPYRYTVIEDETGRVREYDDVVYVAPTGLDWRATLDPEVRALGIFEALLYRGEFIGEATFDLAEIALDPDSIQWNRASLLVGLSDPRGIRGTPVVEWNGKTVKVGPVVEVPGIVGFGAQLPSSVRTSLEESSLEIEPDPQAESLEATVLLRLSLAGSENLTVVPIAADTTFDLEAPWPSPGFVGAHLPTEREITGDGFTANWHIPGLSRTLPRRWAQHRQQTMEGDAAREAFGVELVLPAGGYQRTERAAKYTLLFVGLTFVAFFLFEVLSDLRLHPIQYLLVAAALVVFYLLLLALSEHVGFNLAYAVAAFATCGLIAGYSRAVLGSGKRAGIVLFELTLLYSYLYVVLAAEDFALLSGATGIFAVLSLVMWLTRHLDWYEMGSRPVNVSG